MQRTEKLYRHLDQLEQEYSRLLERELKKVVNNRPSRYLSRKVPHLFDGKFWRDPQTAHMEKLEKDIRAIRVKLGEPISAGVLSIVDRITDQLQNRKDWYDGGSKKVAQQLLLELRAVLLKRGHSEFLGLTLSFRPTRNTRG